MGPDGCLFFCHFANAVHMEVTFFDSLFMNIKVNCNKVKCYLGSGQITEQCLLNVILREPILFEQIQ